ncbi:MAG: hypothetical protein Kow0049_07810 [Stanieria sp.]
MGNSQTNLYLSNTQREQQIIYDHFLQATQTDSPERVIEKFRYLFIKATGYDDNNVRLALETIVNCETANDEFTFILNRCCHIIINRWQMQSDLKKNIPKLIAQFEQALPPGGANSRTSRKLRQLIKDFQTHEHYLKLQRLAKVIGETQENNFSKSQSIGNLIQRYPYLHQHCLLSEDSSYEFKQTVKKIQKNIQRSYEVNLSQYVTYRVRLVQTASSHRNSSINKVSTHQIQPVKNPTLLNDQELVTALRQYVGKVEKGYTYRDLSQNFLTCQSPTSSYKTFKEDLYEYLVFGIEGKYAKHQFKHKLYYYLQNIFPDCHHQKFNEFLMIRTCSQLLKLLIVDSKQNPNHYLFVDLISNLGETKVVGLLLKIVLLCQKIKPYLEQRFSILFSHYESFTEEGVPWLIKSLENLQIAFSVHFGKADLSLVKII